MQHRWNIIDDSCEICGATGWDLLNSPGDCSGVPKLKPEYQEAVNNALRAVPAGCTHPGQSQGVEKA